MKWSKDNIEKITELHESGINDRQIGDIFGVSLFAIRAGRERYEIGTFDKFGTQYNGVKPPGFVIPVTVDVDELKKIDYVRRDFRDHGVEYIVVESEDGYALYREHIGIQPYMPEPPKETWVEHWTPL